MRLFGKKKKPDVETHSYEIFGGFTITKKIGGYEIKWKSPNLTTITVPNYPTIDKNVETRNLGDMTEVVSTECKLTISLQDGVNIAYISKI